MTSTITTPDQTQKATQLIELWLALDHLHVLVLVSHHLVLLGRCGPEGPGRGQSSSISQTRQRVKIRL